MRPLRAIRMPSGKLQHHAEEHRGMTNARVTIAGPQGTDEPRSR